MDMGDHSRINRFGFAEFEDMDGLSRALNIPELALVIERISELIFVDDDSVIDSLSEAAQANFIVPLGMCLSMIKSGGYSNIELMSGVCTVRAGADAHMTEFSKDVVRYLKSLPR